jgi:hypothetical protein
MKLLYKPFGINVVILAGILSKKGFEAVWGVFDKEAPPKPTTSRRPGRRCSTTRSCRAASRAARSR